MIRDEQKVIAMLAVPANDGVRRSIAIGVDGVGVRVALVPMELGRTRTMRQRERQHRENNFHGPHPHLPLTRRGS